MISLCNFSVSLARLRGTNVWRTAACCGPAGSSASQTRSRSLSASIRGQDSRSCRLLFELFIGFVLFVPSLQTATAQDFTLIHDSFDGKSLAQWTENWFTWAWQAPLNQNPLLDTTGANGSVDNDGPVFFIGGTTGSLTSAERTFDVPAGKPLLIPLLNAFDTLDTESTEEALMDEFRASVISLFATIDGAPITSDLVNTDFFSMGETKPGSLIESIGAPVGSELDPTLGSGYWLMVSGLSPGEHTLTFGGAESPWSVAPDGFSTSVIDHINVAVPEPPTWAMMLLGFAGLGFAGYCASRKRIARAV